jgi:hypothetical protein
MVSICRFVLLAFHYSFYVHIQTILVVGRIVTRVYVRHTMLVRIMSGMFRTEH